MRILPQHHTQIERFYEIINILKNKKNNTWEKATIKLELINKLSEKNIYEWRQTKDIDSAANHNIDEPFFYWLIYTIHKDIFISAYWDILYEVWHDTTKRAIVFLFSLFNIQYYHPAKKTVNADLYPFRLFFYLLRDKRIDNYIAIPEMFFLYKTKKMLNIESYENIVKEILIYRKSNQEVKDYFKWQEDLFVKTCVSAKYFLTILNNFNILKFSDNLKNQTILSPKRRDASSININHYLLNNKFDNVIDDLLLKYSIFEKTRDSILPSELATEIFNFLDDDIYNYIWIKKIQDFQLADDIYNYSINPDKCYEFEKKINQAMNKFFNVKSEVVWGSWEPDFVASYKPDFPDDNNKIIFTGDAKSTKNQLWSINPGRLKQHMKKYDSRFTILITPKYAPSAKKDIEDEKIVILSSMALSEMIRNFIKNEDKPSFKDFYEIIESNLWDDISDKFYKKIGELYWKNI